jgi:putative hydrolase of the HAD superfamily
MSAARPVLLLDLGGVLADLGDPVTAMELDLDVPDFWKTWTSSSVVRALETGRISEDDFLRDIPAVLGCSSELPFGPRFHAWQLQLFANVENCVRAATERYRVALLSNTNEIHWRQVTEASSVFDVFDKVFLSYETGHYKPEPAAFYDVMDYFDCAPGEIIFLDDSEPNIVAARKLGIDAHRVVGGAELEKLLGKSDRT